MASRLSAHKYFLSRVAANLIMWNSRFGQIGAKTLLNELLASCVNKPSYLVKRPDSRVQNLWDLYAKAKKAVACFPDAALVNPKAVFANNELDLGKIQVYGFDYDYTLAVYTKELNRLIYDLAMKRLIEHCKYPKGMTKIPYDPRFAVRGLHFDVSESILLKLDAFCQIQKDTACRGKTAVSEEELLRIYKRLSIPEHYVRSPNSSFGYGSRMRQLNDLFSLPEIGLLTTAVQYFTHMNIDFDSNSLFEDVQKAVSHVHLSGDMHKHVIADMNTYVHKNPGLRRFLDRLHSAGKTVFVVSNSPFEFMQHGLNYLLGEDWRDLFHFIVVQAQKPRFFQDATMPFRLLDENTGRLSYVKVTHFRKGSIYAAGNLQEFSKKAGFTNESKVLYFGDHIHSDLADPMLNLGWHTGAIVPELEREIRIQTSNDYQSSARWLLVLTCLVEEMQDSARNHPKANEVVEQWILEMDKIKQHMKSRFHPQFGSIFRTFHNPTYFSRRLMRLSDIYTSRLPNLLQYSMDYTFYPRRAPLPHEQYYSLPDIQYGDLL